jgi:hypothetical protein
MHTNSRGSSVDTLFHNIRTVIKYTFTFVIIQIKNNEHVVISSYRSREPTGEVV